MDDEKIKILGAREHNLQNVDLEIPRGKLVVFTGLSGSGKSSLAFDTIHAEGQRRYMETFSAYARRIITTWGGDLNGYACRGWCGLVRDYYLPCWQAYIDEAMQAARAGRPFDEKGFNQRMERFQLAWCEPGTPHDEGMDYPHDVLALSRMLLKKYRTELAAFIQAHTATASNKK